MGLLASFLCLFGCKSKEEKFLEKHEVLFCKTETFDTFVRKAKIKPKVALELMSNYSKENNVQHSHLFYFIIDGHYVFSSYIHLKIPEVYTGGIWVNSENGEIKLVKKGLYIRAYHEYNWKKE